MFKCLNYYFPEFKFAGSTSEVIFNIFPLYELDKYNKYENDKKIVEILKSRIEKFDIGCYKSLEKFAYADWIKEVDINSDNATLINYSIAIALKTEFDVYISTERLSCALELKLRSDFCRYQY